MNESREASATAEPSQPSKSRLVIRVKITPETSPPSASPRGIDKRRVALLLGVIAALAIIWISISVFSRDSITASAVSEEQVKTVAHPPVRNSRPNEPMLSSEPAQDAAPSGAETGSASAVLPEHNSSDNTSASSAQQQQEIAPSPINEVIPEVPQSALQTIRGTVRVTIRVTVEPEGTVLTASSDDPGPSRYFERLSLEAARQWTFTPAATNEERVALLRFHYTREGATAHTQPVD